MHAVTSHLILKILIKTAYVTSVSNYPILLFLHSDLNLLLSKAGHRKQTVFFIDSVLIYPAAFHLIQQ
jgi:hypothetical protein